ncbi:amino acid ABC transporter ATP-binding/permease protein [Fusibacter bizertensis]
MKTVKPLKSLYLLLFVNHRKPLIYALFFTVFTVLFSTGLMAFSAYIISFSALMPSISEIMVAITLVRFLGIGRALFRYVERLLSHNAVFLYLSQLRTKLYLGVSHLSSEAIVNLNRKSAFNLLTTDIENLQDYFLRGILPLISSFFIWGIASIGLWQINKIQSILFFLFYPISTLGIAWIINRFTKRASGQFTLEKKIYHSDFSSYADFHGLLKWQGSKTAKLNGINQQSTHMENACESMNQGTIIANNFQQFLINLHVLLTIILGLLLVTAGSLKGIWLATFVLATFSLYEAAPTVLTFFQKTDACDESANNIISYTQLEVPGACNGDKKNEPTFEISKTTDGHITSIFYKPLTFNFQLSDFKIDFPAFTLESGKHIAIVGPSGSGKSTLASLICGFYGEDSHRELSEYFSVVNQEIYLFNDRLVSNLFVKEDHPNLTRALALSGLDPLYFVNTNPWIGEDGVKLSGGQRQRLGLARALLRDKPFLILDEAFSGLEPEKENEILQNLLHRTNHTLIWITHRLVAMEQMKVIYVMDRGKLIASGTHATLKSTCPLYQSLLEQ